MIPISVRKVMGNTNSLLHQVVHAPWSLKMYVKAMRDLMKEAGMDSVSLERVE